MSSMTSEDLHDRIDHDFTNHPPVDPGVVDTFEILRLTFKDAAHTVVDRCPASREQSLALTNLEQGLMYAIAAVARNQGK